MALMGLFGKKELLNHFLSIHMEMIRHVVFIHFK